MSSEDEILHDLKKAWVVASTSRVYDLEGVYAAVITTEREARAALTRASARVSDVYTKLEMARKEATRARAAYEGDDHAKHR